MPPVSQLTTQCGGKHICAGVPSWSFDAVLMPYTGATLTQCKSRTETLLTSKHSKPRSAISKALFFFSSRSIARYWLLVTALALPCMHEGAECQHKSEDNAKSPPHLNDLQRPLPHA